MCGRRVLIRGRRVTSLRPRLAAQLVWSSVQRTRVGSGADAVRAMAEASVGGSGLVSAWVPMQSAEMMSLIAREAAYNAACGRVDLLGDIRGLSRLSCQHPFQGAVEELRPFQGVDVDAASLQQREGPSPPRGKLGFDLRLHWRERERSWQG